MRSRAEALSIVLGRIFNHLLGLIGTILAVAGIIALGASHSVRAWTSNNGVLLYAILITFAVVTFVVVDYLLHRRPPSPSAHDKKIFGRIYSLLLPEGDAIYLLREETIWNGYRYELLDKLDEAIHIIDTDQIGMDNRHAETAYRGLLAALGKFRNFQALNTFPAQGRELAVLSDRWSDERRNEAGDKINDLATAAANAYSDFLKVCHKYGIDAG